MEWRRAQEGDAHPSCSLDRTSTEKQKWTMVAERFAGHDHYEIQIARPFFFSLSFPRRCKNALSNQAQVGEHENNICRNCSFCLVYPWTTPRAGHLYNPVIIPSQLPRRTSNHCSMFFFFFFDENFFLDWRSWQFLKVDLVTFIYQLIAEFGFKNSLMGWVIKILLL